MPHTKGKIQFWAGNNNHSMLIDYYLCTCVTLSPDCELIVTKRDMFTAQTLQDR